MKNSIYDINYLWIMFVILHVSGASLLMLFYGIPFLYLILINLSMLVFIIYTGKMSHVSLVQHLRIKPITGRQVGIALLMTICFLIMSEYINAWSLLFSNNYVGSVLANASSNLSMTLLTYAVVPAIVEEMMFRGCILRGSSNRGIALFLSAVTFALLHGNLNQICYAFFMGIALGVVVLLTDNLVVTILMHGLFNAYSILTVAFAESHIVVLLENIKVGPYAIFAPVLEKSQMKAQLVIGGVVFLVVGILAYLLLRIFYKEKIKVIFKEEPNAIANPWKIDIKFGVGCLVCIVLAMLSQ